MNLQTATVTSVAMKPKYANEIQLGCAYTLTRGNTKVSGYCQAVWTDHATGNLALTRIKLEHLGWLDLADWNFIDEL